MIALGLEDVQLWHVRTGQELGSHEWILPRGKLQPSDRKFKDSVSVSAEISVKCTQSFFTSVDH
jgi:hypothetical protein